MNAKPKNGATEAFLRAHIGHAANDCVLWPFSTRNGYGAAMVGGVPGRANRWMCVLAHGEPPTPSHHAAHSCGNRACVNPLHLRWATRLENEADKLLHGTRVMGESHGQTRLKTADIIAIRRDVRTQEEIAADYGMTRSNVGAIRTRKSWRHVQ